MKPPIIIIFIFFFLSYRAKAQNFDAARIAGVEPDSIALAPLVYLASDNLKGRHIGGAGINIAANYIVDQFQFQNAANLRPQHVILIIEYDTDRPTPVWVLYPMSFASLQTFFHNAGYSTILRLADHPSIYHRNAIYSAYIA
jgi:hypothetical protein